MINGRIKTKQAGIDVQLGLMKGEARRLNKIFIANHLIKAYYYKKAQTLTKNWYKGAGQVRITNNHSKMYMLRREHDSIMIGSGA